MWLKLLSLTDRHDKNQGRDCVGGPAQRLAKCARETAVERCNIGGETVKDAATGRGVCRKKGDLSDHKFSKWRLSRSD